MKRTSYILLTCAAMAWTILMNLDLATSKQSIPTLIEDVWFVENQGQWEGPFLYHAKFDHVNLYVEPDRLTYAILDPATHSDHDHHHGHDHAAHVHHRGQPKGHCLQVVFEGANETPRIIGLEKEAVYHNYYLGSDSSKWRSRVPIYNAVKYKDIYDGIDMDLYKKDGNLKYDFIIKPGANPADISLRYDGLDKIKLKKGQLILKTSIGDIVEQAPIAFQTVDGKRKTVPCNFALEKNQVNFEFPKGYDEKFPLIIDPILIFSTFSGSIADNFGTTATFDQDGNGYLGSMVFNQGYPITVGAFDATFNSPDSTTTDVAISKFTANGSNLIYSTYLGGRATDVPHSLIVNNANELIVMGTTSSDNFPTTSNAFDRTYNGGDFTPINQSSLVYEFGVDLFITKFSVNGATLQGSTFLGGSEEDGLNSAQELQYYYADDYRGEVIVNESGEIFVASSTTSRDFPTTAGAFNTTHNGGTFDAVVVKFSPDLSQLRWSTYFGGTGNDCAYSMKLDANENVYFIGGTSSENLPTSANAISQNYNGQGSDGFVARLNSGGSALPSCTYLGTSSDDQGYFLEIDPAGDIFAIGTSRGGTYPVTPGRYNNPGSAQFLHKLKPNLDSTFFSTTLGNNSSDGTMSLNAFMIDDCHRIYYSGWFGSVGFEPVFGFPITPDAFQSTTDGSDFYFGVLEPDARDIEYGTYFGGNLNQGEHVDGGTSRFDRRGIIYQAICAGCFRQSDLPTTTTAFSRENRSSCNAALVKFDFQLDEIDVRANASPALTGCAPFVVNFNNQSRGPIDIYQWNFGDGGNSNEFSPTHTFEAGTYIITLVGSSEFDCVDPDTVQLYVQVFEPTGSSAETLTKCEEDNIQLSSNNQRPGASYEWNTGATSSGISASTPGVYWVKSLSGAGCFVDSFIVENLPVPSSIREIEGCEPNDYILRPLELNDAFGYQWSDGSSNPSLTVEAEGIYWVRTLNPFDCDRIDSFNVLEYPLLKTIYHNISLCPGKEATLQPTDFSSDNTYVWSTGATSPTINVDQPGVYWSETFYPNPDACTRLDSFIIDADTINVATLDSVRICEGQTITISSLTQGPEGSYRWSTGETTPSIEVSETGLYEVVSDFPLICPYTNQFQVNAFPVIDENDIYVPNAFSPNNDGVNDVFRPFFSDLVILNSYKLQVFNRWGGKVFQTTDVRQGWDGGSIRISESNSSRAQEAEAVFVWLLEVNLVSCSGDPLDVKMKGDIAIIR